MPLDKFKFIVRPGDARTVFGPRAEHARWIESQLVRGDDGEIVGVQPAAFQLDPAGLLDALRLLTERLAEVTPHQAGHRLDDLAWTAADGLMGSVNDYLQDAPPQKIEEIVAALTALQAEIARLRVMTVRDADGRMTTVQTTR